MGFWDFMSGSTPGGAVGTVAKEAITSVFDGLGKIIDDLNTSDEEKMAAKLEVKKLQLGVIQAYIDDVQNARAMQIQTRSMWPGIMSAMAGIGFFGGFIVVLLHGLPVNLDEFTKSIIYMFAGAMVASWTSAQNFWMGSTMGSQNKDQLLHQSTPTKKDP